MWSGMVMDVREWGGGPCTDEINTVEQSWLKGVVVEVVGTLGTMLVEAEVKVEGEEKEEYEVGEAWKGSGTVTLMGLLNNEGACLVVSRSRRMLMEVKIGNTGTGKS